MRWILLSPILVALAHAHDSGTGVAPPPGPSPPPPPIPPGVSVFNNGQGGYQTYHIPALLALPSGQLLAFAQAGGKVPPNQGIVDLVLKRSTDGGKTWGPVEVVVSLANSRIENPAPAVQPDTGEIFLMFTPNNSRVMYKRSTTQGVSWSPPIDITTATVKPGVKMVFTGPPGSLFTRSGRLIVPAHMNSGGLATDTSYYFYSDDLAKTWNIGSGMGFEMGSECQMAELLDGTLVLSMRPGGLETSRKRFFAVSHDRGGSWKTHAQNDMPDGDCQGSLVAIGNVLYQANIPGTSKVKRANITIWSSTDHEALQWELLQAVWPGDSAYNSLQPLPSTSGRDRLGLLYETGGHDHGNRINYLEVVGRDQSHLELLV